MNPFLKMRLEADKHDEVVQMPLLDLLKDDVFIETCADASKMWLPSTKPEINTNYWLASRDKIGLIIFTKKSRNYGRTYEPRFWAIHYFLRDGHTEYRVIDEQLAKAPKRSKLAIALRHLKLCLPHYRANKPTRHRYSRDFLIDTGYKVDTQKYDVHYVVFDVETNGIRTRLDDLLSLSIYDPSTGMCYNRYFPLDLQPLVLTGWVNGITDDTLEDYDHMSQEEMDAIIDYFDLKNSVLLFYGGRRFDRFCVNHYCERHGIRGFEELPNDQFKNIKDLVPRPSYEVSGFMSKDNLCIALGIEGVGNVHSGMNDCVLEWKLFEELKSSKLFIIHDEIYEYEESYIIPATVLNYASSLYRFAGIQSPPVTARGELLFEYELPKEAVSKMSKLPTNMNGVAIEHVLNTKLNAIEQDNRSFLAANKSKLKVRGRIPTPGSKMIPVSFNPDGTLTTPDEDEAAKRLVAESNRSTKELGKYLSSTLDFIRNDIFHGEKILSHEMVISDDRKVLALCDLSSAHSVLEIKTGRIFLGLPDKDPNELDCEVTDQLYFEKANRNVYLLKVNLNSDAPVSYVNSVGLESVSIQIFKVVFSPIEIKAPAKANTAA